MSENTGSYGGVMIFAVVCGILAIGQLLNANVIEAILAVVAILCCLGLLIKQKLALIGMCLTLLAGIMVYFSETILRPITEEDPGLILPNVIRLLISILLFAYIGRVRVESRFS